MRSFLNAKLSPWRIGASDAIRVAVRTYDSEYPSRNPPRVVLVSESTDGDAHALSMELARRDCSHIRINTDLPAEWPTIELNPDLGVLTVTDAVMGRSVGPALFSQFGHEVMLRNSESFPDELLTSAWRCVLEVALRGKSAVNFAAKAAAESKIAQLDVAKSVGFNVPLSIVTSNAEVFVDFVCEHGAVVVKPLGAHGIGTSHGVLYQPILTVSESEAKSAACRLDQLRLPVLVQRHYRATVEWRVQVVDGHVYAYRIEKDPEGLLDGDTSGIASIDGPVELPSLVRDSCAQIAQVLGLEYSAVDLLELPNGDFVFLEINARPSFAWMGVHCDLQPVVKALADLLIKKASI